MSTRSLNRVTLIGNLTRDPELKYTPQGTAVCTFGLATNREWTDSSGQKQEGVEFHRIVAWGKLGEICSQLLIKGQKAFVEGRLQTRQWKTQDGSDRQVTEVVIEEMIALNTPKGASSDGYEPNYTTISEPAKVEQVSPAEEVFSADDKGASKDVSDEIPF
ncbi:TPA: single-stranded DNA-binding protein [Candidatus Collierbacteria bacterium]|uniref:Single-stranded DNA-binding protein n=1 Tax=Candidatus Collierbacteria bacterium GW2011_GWB2_44_22 TaxID=1618387 RepID=A0A0G1HYN1_9BACT|nr:MAG: Single-stranded DNA-binding protein [Candidatus Collierbacteria bacterium GW2011_GWA2_44_13]KKT52065.1 MAG: Single-stranded DNA-binding protein [Candidatus Collierbacteria bacterium GW2011_GWB2_44_22]KKT62605.1 MAG: Single-stranded DNA-binding protein [Candidatus Collierbacteria bacterium GW2011_GWD1_44_27]KKT66019.1 MAG: Single-stranded DNA-binding protein [Candidatus Collierbacteria bacterium GW2011_GWC2_44_30]KKT68069.1 MAG: Single-stranded DNA-binding protein [Microgenomates group b